MTSLSARSFVETRLNTLSDAVLKRRSAGLPVLDLTISNPTQVGLKYPPALLALLADARALSYAPEPFGVFEARAAVAAEYDALGAKVSPDRVLLTASTSEAYAFAFKLLCDPGDEVLVPSPSYPLLEHLARYEGVNLKSYRLGYDGGWYVDRASLMNACSVRTRAVVAIHPNNPTGQYLKLDELTWLKQLGLPLIADEVFARYPLRPMKGVPATTLVDERGLTLALGGLSKSVGLPQLKLGWMVIGGSDERVVEATQRLAFLADTYLSVSTPVQLAAAEVLREGSIIRDALLERIKSNLNLLEERVPHAGISVLFVEGGWSAVLQLPSLLSEEAWSLELLERDGVLVQPGYLYDFEEEPRCVVSLLSPPEVVEAGLAAMIARARKLLA